MNVKSMCVGFLIAMFASTGTYLLVPPPKDADAVELHQETMELVRLLAWDMLEACSISGSSAIVCDKKRYTSRHGVSLDSK